MIAGFRQGLTAAGFNEGQNVAIEYRYADNQLERLPGLVAELIRLPVAVIVANVNAALAAKAATTTMPIVFVTGSDPVVDGLVASLNRPGGNVTGVSFVSGLLGAKRLEMLRQLVPAATTMAMLVGTDTLEARIERRDVELAAQALGQQLIIAPVSSEARVRWRIHVHRRARRQSPAGRNRTIIDIEPGAARSAGGPPRHSCHLCGARIRRSRRPDELWREHHRGVSAGRHLCGPDPQRREAGRSAGACNRPSSSW